MTFGKWWELIEKYKYGITYEIANKLVKYINKYQNEIPCSINIMQQEQILSFANYNEYCIAQRETKKIEMKENNPWIN